MISRGHLAPLLAGASLLGACGAQGSTASPTDDAALTEASRVWIDRSEPDAEGWRLLYRNRGEVALRCRANLRWVEEHPPHRPLGEVEERFELPPQASVAVVFRSSLRSAGIADAASVGPGDVDAPEARGPALRAEYALIEAERDGLYLRCDPPVK